MVISMCSRAKCLSSVRSVSCNVHILERLAFAYIFVANLSNCIEQHNTAHPHSAVGGPH